MDGKNREAAKTAAYIVLLLVFGSGVVGLALAGFNGSIALQSAGQRLNQYYSTTETTELAYSTPIPEFPSINLVSVLGAAVMLLALMVLRRRAAHEK